NAASARTSGSSGRSSSLRFSWTRRQRTRYIVAQRPGLRCSAAARASSTKRRGTTTLGPAPPCSESIAFAAGPSTHRTSSGGTLRRSRSRAACCQLSNVSLMATSTIPVPLLERDEPLHALAGEHLTRVDVALRVDGNHVQA